jgi:hypothetical protein
MFAVGQFVRKRRALHLGRIKRHLGSFCKNPKIDCIKCTHNRWYYQTLKMFTLKMFIAIETWSLARRDIQLFYRGTRKPDARRRDIQFVHRISVGLSAILGSFCKNPNLIA